MHAALISSGRQPVLEQSCFSPGAGIPEGIFQFPGIQVCLDRVESQGARTRSISSPPHQPQTCFICIQIGISDRKEPRRILSSDVWGPHLPLYNAFESLVVSLPIDLVNFIYLFFINLFILFVYFWLRWVFVQGGATLCCGARAFFIVVASLVVEHGFQVLGLQQLWLAGSGTQAQQL